MDGKLLSPKYFKALELVAELFKDKKRNISDVPYIVHLVGVSYILSQVTSDESVIIAGLLHDVLEDIDPGRYGEPEMRRDFGDKITDTVKIVSHDEDKYGKDQARQIYLDQIEQSPLSEAWLVSAADLLYNATDILQMYDRMPEIVKQKFGGERAVRRTWFWTERYNILSSKLGEDNQIIQELEPVLARLEEIHAEIR